MTKKEAIEHLNGLLLRADITDEYGDLNDYEPYETAVDMAIEALSVEVVHCKECEEWEISMVVHGRGVCTEWSDFENGRIRLTEGNEFCSYGERKRSDD